MTTRLVRLGLSTAVLLACVTACGGKEVPQSSGSTAVKSASASSSQTPSQTSPAKLTDDDITKFVEILGAGDPAKDDAVIAMTSADSVAHAYATYTKESDQADISAGNDAVAGKVTNSGDVWSLCFTNSDSGEDTCTKYSNFTADGALIDAFDVNEVPLAQRISVGNGRIAKVGSLATVRILTVYKAAAGDLVISLEVKAAGAKFSFSDDTAYVAPDGSQTNLTSLSGPSTFLPNTKTTITVDFKGAPRGGSLYLDAFGFDGAASGNVTIKTE